jgi:hypothetical protein
MNVCVNVTSITELPTQASAPALNGTSTLSAQSPQSFSDSLFAASKASSQSSIVQDSSPKGDRQQKSNSDDAKQPGAVADHRAAQTQDVAQQPVAPQPATPDVQAQLTNSIVAPLQQSFESPKDISNLPGGSTTTTASSFATGAAPGDEAGAEASVVQPASLQATNTPVDSSTMQAASSFTGFAAQARAASTGIFSKSWNGVSTTVAPATASSTQQSTQNSSTLATPHGLLFSIPASNRQDASDATQAVASTDLMSAASGTVLAATAADVPSSFPGQASAASSHAATTASQVTQPDVAANGIPSSFPQEFLNSSSTSAAPKDMAGALSAVPATAQNTASTIVPAVMRNPAQMVETGAVPVQSPSIVPSASVQAVDSATPESVVHGFWRAVQNAAPDATTEAAVSAGANTNASEPSIPLPARNQDEEAAVASNVMSNAAQASAQDGTLQAAYTALQGQGSKAVADATSTGAASAASVSPAAVPNATPHLASDAVASSAPVAIHTVATITATNAAPIGVQVSISDPMAGNSAGVLSSTKSNGAVTPALSPHGISSSIPIPGASSVPSALPTSVPNAAISPAPARTQESSGGEKQDSDQTPLSMATAEPAKNPATAPDAIQPLPSDAAPKAVADEAQTAGSFPPASNLTSPAQSTAMGTAADRDQNPLTIPESSTASSVVQDTSSNAAPGTGHNPSPIDFVSTVLSVVQSTVQDAAPSNSGKPAPSAGGKTAPGTSHDSVASAPQAMTANPVQSVVLNQLPSSPANDRAVQDMRSALGAAAKGAVAPAVSATPAVHTAAPHTAASTPSPVSSNTDANHMSASAQPSGQLNMSQTVTPNLNATPVSKPVSTAASDSKPETKDSASDTAGLKQHSLSTQDQAGTQTGSQTTTSSDQTQGTTTSQVPSTVPAEMNITNHAVASATHAQDVVSNVPAAVGTSTAREAGIAAKTPEAAGTASAAAAAAPMPPAVNTAKLIQSVGQSEMRVGMRSNEFGNISINTSATKELLSAQISLDHGELAKTLATHLPEMQTRLGNNQAVDVRIDMNGQGTGTSSGMSNSSSDHSRDNRSQAGSAASAFSRAGLGEPTSSLSGAVMTAGEGGTSSRLDITV